MRPSFAHAALIAVVFALGPAPPASSEPNAAALKLGVAQRAVIAENLWRRSVGAIPIGFEAAIGTMVPPAIKLQSLPRAVVEQIPALKELEYAKTRNQILIADPVSRKVVAVFNR